MALVICLLLSSLLLNKSWADTAFCFFFGDQYACLPTDIIPASAINWDNLSKDISASGINWLSLNKDVRNYAVNWSTLSQDVKASGINWLSLNQDIKTGNINWNSIVNQEMNFTGINWMEVDNYSNGKTLKARTSATAGINWE